MAKKKVQDDAVIRSQLDELDELRIACENDLYKFACVMAPVRYYGDVHKEVFRWLANFDQHNKLLLLPRDHQKSFCLAMLAAWIIAREPTATILYLSATATLAEKQLYQIKQILDSDQFKMLWPDMLKPEAGQREKWTNSEINVDHPARKEFGIRDATVVSGGLTRTIAGLHPKYIFLDDLVVPENAYTKEGRHTVKALYSQLSSIESSAGYQFAAGTPYHKDDLYYEMENMEAEDYNDFGDFTGMIKVYDIFKKVVEKDGVFVWPKGKTPDGRDFGFDAKLLAMKKAKYLDKAQFYAQYYLDVTRGDGSGIDHTRFQYYNPQHIVNRNNVWHYRNRRLNLVAAIDFAYSIRESADYTCLIVIGIDSEKNIFILDLDRFRTKHIHVYFDAVKRMHSKWGFRKLVAEVNAAQSTIADFLKDEIKKNGALITIDEVRPNRHAKQDKAERLEAILNPQYADQRIWHPEGSLCTELEEELVQQYPQHDDCKDALANAIAKAVAPKQDLMIGRTESKIISHPYFGGVMGRRVSYGR